MPRASPRSLATVAKSTFPPSQTKQALGSDMTQPEPPLHNVASTRDCRCSIVWQKQVKGFGLQCLRTALLAVSSLCASTCGQDARTSRWPQAKRRKRRPGTCSMTRLRAALLFTAATLLELLTPKRLGGLWVVADPLCSPCQRWPAMARKMLRQQKNL